MIDELGIGESPAVAQNYRMQEKLRHLVIAVHPSRRTDQRSRFLAHSKQSPLRQRTKTGKAFLGMLSVFAEFETNVRRERQLEGIAAAKKAGVYKGRPATISPAAIAALKAEGLGASAIAKRLGIGRASVYRVWKGAPSVSAVKWEKPVHPVANPGRITSQPTFWPGPSKGLFGNAADHDRGENRQTKS